SILDTVWFIVVTASTVGYGDMTPNTPAGKILTMFIIVTGTVAVAIFTAYLSAVYNKRTDDARIHEIENYIKRVEHKNARLERDIRQLRLKIESLEEAAYDTKEDVDSVKDTVEGIDEKLDKLIDE
ncbi:MAG: ion channel, partial [Methanosphaera sp.]|nr:ion channel [Methanosphaera sp.]